jgi:hypothetical protein
VSDDIASLVGACFVCGVPYRDHAVWQLDICLDMPLSVVVVEEVDEEQ